ncbi:MAG: acyl--CoA ligase [Clostridiales bacterium]|jgi:long-chain acyl-CoA synthetase|nr:acyl--CoA ligase [Clostridiales bacterium]
MQRLSEKNNFDKSMYEMITEELIGDEPYDRSGQGLIFLRNAVGKERLMRDIDGLSEFFGLRGIAAGENIAVCLPNFPQTVIAVYALNKRGIIANMTHPLISVNGLRGVIKKTRPKMLFISDLFFKKYAEVIAETGIETVVCKMGEYAAGWLRPLVALKFLKSVFGIRYGGKILRYADALKEGLEAAERRKTRDASLAGGGAVNPVNASGFASEPADNGDNKRSGKSRAFGLRNDDRDKREKGGTAPAPELPKGGAPAVYFHSGGTTGEPKTIVMSNRAINMQSKSIIECFIIWAGDVPKKGTVFVPLPIFHCFGLNICLHPVLALGQTAVLTPRFDAKTAAVSIKKYKTGYIPGVPIMFEKLMGTKTFQKTDMSFIKGAVSGGDTLNPDVKERFDALLKKNGSESVLYQGYGLTEAGGVLACDLLKRFKPNMIGQPFSGVRIKIVDENLNELPAGEKGEILVSCQSLMDGYLDDPEATAKVFFTDKDGVKWLRTEDLGYTDKDGDLYFADRKKRMEIIAGENVYPTEIEAVVSRVPEVETCCAVRAKRPDGKPFIKLLVVPRVKADLNGGDNHNAALAALRGAVMTACRNNLLVHSIPAEIAFRKSLPLTDLEKTDYRKLEEEEARKA